MSNDPIQAYRDAVAAHQAAVVELDEAEAKFRAADTRQLKAREQMYAAERSMKEHILSTPAPQPE